MRLRALELEQFRKFDLPVRLSGFSDHVNVLCGPNEFGKSTLLAAIRAVLFERHNSSAQPIKAMKPWRGDAAPRLAMEFETAEGLWRIEKRFLHQPMARLTAPDGGRYDGDAAEETLQRLLGFGASGKQGAKAEHMGVWGALWVTQRESVQQPDLTTELARLSIADCLDAEVGALTGGEKGQALIRAVRAELGQLLDGNRKPRGRYRETVARIAELDAALAALRERAARLVGDTDDFRQKTRVLAQANAPETEARARASLEDARRLREVALLHQERLEAARSALGLAERDCIECERETLARQSRLTALRAQEARLAAALATEGDARTVADAAEIALASGRERLAAAEERAEAAGAAGRRARDVVDHLRRVATLAVRDRAAIRADIAQAAVNALAARVQALRIDAASLATIRKVSAERDAAEAVLHAQATRVEFDLLPDGFDRVTAAGLPLQSATHAIGVVEDLDIEIAGIGRVRVRPVIRDRDKLLFKLQKADAALRSVLSTAGCADLHEAERCWAERETLERDLVTARAELARLAPGDEEAGVPAGAAALREQLDLVRRRVEAEQAAFSEAPPDLPAAIAAADAAPALERAAAAYLVTARVELEGSLGIRSDARDVLTKANAEVGRTRADQVRLDAEAAEATRREPDAALADRLAKAALIRLRAASEFTARERDRPEHGVEAMNARVERNEAALRNLEQTRSKLHVEIAGLRARIAQEGGFGLHEVIAAAEREYEALGVEQQGFAREVRVLTLLLETLVAAERATKERYLAPVVRRVTPHLRSLFPGADVTCDDTLRITGLMRADLGSQEFDRLSDGTQEQIAVLARLAFAEMLKDRGKPAMVILDDALAYSDAERIERMFDILTRVSAKMQLLILTCRDDLFARIGGTRIELQRLQPSAHESASSFAPKLL